jgi:hypothetical protein
VGRERGSLACGQKKKKKKESESRGREFAVKERAHDKKKYNNRKKINNREKQIIEKNKKNGGKLASLGVTRSAAACRACVRV